MVRMRINTARNSGMVFHFTDAPETIESIYDSGLRLGSEPTRETDKRIAGKYDEDGNLIEEGMGTKRGNTTYAPYASLTRNPSSILQYKSDGWRYGIILDQARLTDHMMMRPYFYNNKPETGFITFYWDNDAGKMMVESSVGDPVTLTDDEEDAIWELTNDPAFKDKVHVETKNLQTTIRFNLGNSTVDRSDTLGYKLKPTSLKELPPVIFNILKKAGYEGEERAYAPYDTTIDIKKAIRGILVPDVEFFDQDVQDCALHCGLSIDDIYIYRAWDEDKSSKRYLDFVQRAKQVNPAILQRYILPSF